jgi:hypothetical protein
MSTWLYTSKRTRRNTGQNFEYYHNKKTGKPVYWVNDRGENLERGPFIEAQMRFFDDQNAIDIILLNYLKDHPGKGKRFDLTDQTAVAQMQEQETKRYTQISRKLFTTKKEDVESLLEMMGYEGSSELAIGRLIQDMRDPNLLNQVDEALNMKNKPMVLGMRRMIKYGIISIKDSSYIAHDGRRLAISEAGLADVLSNDPELYKMYELETNRKEADHKKRESTKPTDLSEH